MFKKFSIIMDLFSGLMLTLGLRFLFPVCDMSQNVMKCFYSAQAISVIGVVLMAIGLIKLFAKKSGCTSLSLVSAVVLLAGASFPAFVIGGCIDLTMACHLTELKQRLNITNISLHVDFAYCAE